MVNRETSRLQTKYKKLKPKLARHQTADPHHTIDLFKILVDMKVSKKRSLQAVPNKPAPLKTIIRAESIDDVLADYQKLVSEVDEYIKAASISMINKR